MRLIDADALANKLIEQFSRKKDLQSEVILNTMLWKINQAPSVEGERVVRCRDCKYWHGVDYECNRPDGNYYCADGERKDND